MECHNCPYLCRLVSNSPGCFRRPCVSASGQPQNTEVRGASFLPFFQPVAIETLGPINLSASDFISEIGNHISSITGDRRESKFLFQRLSVCIQRFNLVAFKGTFSSFPDLPDNCIITIASPEGLYLPRVKKITMIIIMRRFV